jgi:murein DD-endopeptidase MepM/ murein hydrolase activator NlpD
MEMIIPTPGRITSKYGKRIHPVTKVADRFHNGIDIAGPIGQKIVSPANGKVIQTYNHEFGGITLIILHDNGFESRMCHLNKVLVATGERVTQGQTIAEVGNTGRSTGPHLHYGIRNAKKEYVDPETVINFNI